MGTANGYHLAMSIRAFTDNSGLPLTSEEKLALQTFDEEVARGLVHNGNWVCLIGKLRLLGIGLPETSDYKVTFRQDDPTAPREFWLVKYYYHQNYAIFNKAPEAKIFSSVPLEIIHVREVWGT